MEPRDNNTSGLFDPQGTSSALSREIAAYDAYCKRQLSRKPILARLLKGCVPEFAERSIDDIERNCLPTQAIVGNKPLDPSDALTSLVTSLHTEDSSPNEGTIVFDVLFRANMPWLNESAAVLVNVEPQGNWNPAYPLMARAAYYCARLLSSQKGSTFAKSDYGGLQKVYSIWVLTNPPQDLRGVVLRTCLKWEDLSVAGTKTEEEQGAGTMGANVAENLERLLGSANYADIVVIGLRGYDNGEYGDVVALLDALLSQNMSARERVHIIRDGYGISDAGIQREADTMGDSVGLEIAREAWNKGITEGRAKGMAEGIAEGRAKGMAEGRAEGMAEGITQALSESVRALIGTLGFTCDQAMDALKIPQDKRPSVLSALEQG